MMCLRIFETITKRLEIGLLFDSNTRKSKLPEDKNGKMTDKQRKGNKRWNKVKRTKEGSRFDRLETWSG